MNNSILNYFLINQLLSLVCILISYANNKLRVKFNYYKIKNILIAN